MKSITYLVIVSLLILSITSCTFISGGEKELVPSAGLGKPNVSELAIASNFVPIEAASYFFTNWKLIKEYEGVAELTSEAPIEQRLKFLRNPFLGHQAHPSNGLELWDGVLQNSFKVFGFDQTDLDWEISISNVHVFKLRDNFDTEALKDHLAQYEQSSEDMNYSLYSMPWKRLHTKYPKMAFFDQKKIIVLTKTNSEKFKEVIETIEEKRPSQNQLQQLNNLITALGQVAGAIIASNVNFGKSYVCDPFAYGYRYEGDKLIAQILLRVDENEWDPKEKFDWINRNISRYTKDLNGNEYYTVDSTEILNNMIYINVTPRNNFVKVFFNQYELMDHGFLCRPGQ